MRVRLFRPRPPHKTLVGVLLILLGVAIVLAALPGFVYAAVIGGLIAGAGYMLIGR
ncbi:MAG: hypothetical protein DIU55_003185 [Bacillota bacterium]